MVILDMLMPYMTGVETARALRAEAFGEQLMIIAMSGWPNILDKSLEHRVFNDKLLKPVRHDVLKDLLERAADDITG